MKDNNQEEQIMLENTNIVNEDTGKLVDSCTADEVDTSSEIDGQNDLSNNETESSTLQIIDKLISLYSSENVYLLEVIQPYDQLVDQIDTQKAVLSAICEDVKRANSLYDGFKRAFSQVIDNANCGEKLYYALPLYDDFDEKDEWISLWRQVTQLALAEENKDCIRVFLNKNLYNNTVSFPKDLYFFKPHPKELKNLDTNVKKNVLVFYSRLYTFYKLVKDFSESLRTSLLKSLLASPEYFNNMPKKTGLPTLEELEADKELQKQLFDSDDSSEIDFRLARYKTMQCDDDKAIKILEAPDVFITKARSIYQEYMNFQNELGSLKKAVYTTSLTELYKLYDIISKSLEDFKQLESVVSETDETSLLCCHRFSNILEDLLDTISSLLNDAYSIRPLKIDINTNFNEYDINWYDVLVSEDAPTADKKECVSSISDTGFAKYDIDDNVEFVTRTAKISVYNNKVVTPVSAN